ncbi:MAG: T9SS type A sorting domain-containing protein [Bacteroidota bacterium]|nr:T9SS type A sorting domain-containing protein [Bacteroidota bacterium]
MKTVLRSLLFIALVAFSAGKLRAQCTVSDIFIQNIRNVVPGTGTCTVTFDATFNIANNGGNKYIFIHAWLQSEYPDYFQCVNGNPTLNGSIAAPDAGDLGNSFFNIGIDNNGPIPTILTVYPPDPSVTLTTVNSITRVVLPDGSANITLIGVTTTVSVPCGTPVVIVADLWSSQSSNAQRAHCVNCGILSTAGYISVTGFIFCGNPPTYSAIVTNNTGIALNGYYRVYADVNRDGYFTPVTDTLISGPITYGIVAGPATTTTVGGSIPVANLGQNIFLVFTQTTGTGTGASRVILLRSPLCSPLPVSFTSFTAKRINRSNVTLRWETATETNNSGFGLQRNIGNNVWETIAFIRSQALGGNSSSMQVYTYNDLNASKDISQYRIQQVDIDGRSKLSDIRTVRGDGQKGRTLIYPNPSQDGRVNVVFEDREVNRAVTLADISGRIIRQWKAINGNTIQIDNLKPGIYLLRTIIPETGENTVEKIVVGGIK